MDFTSSPVKKLSSSVPGPHLNIKTSITCTNVPEALFDTTMAKKHFTKFGRVQKIRLFPKKHMCIVVYDHPTFAERAVLNAGAFEGAMFGVTRTKPRVRKRSKKDDDPDWVPDSDVEEELAAMSGGPSYRITRQKPMEVESEVKVAKPTRMIKQLPFVKRTTVRENPAISHAASGIESPVPVIVAQTTMSTMEAATELHQLRSRISLTPDEQWRTLDARDRILRAWGGTGSRVKVGGATIGTCQDMCPEKELLHRQAEYQVLTLETVVDSDGQMDPGRAVKQYSRSSADQEIPMCYELRPAAALMHTCAYLLHEIADTKRPVTLADWFHFMWDRFRGIRKDITQQALCCSESIRLVEMCARFHAHCAARLADLEHTQFDQKLNTDNLTKCLQTLKHMYADVGPEQKPREAEFRGYIALLNLGDANFWWEIQQLPLDIQKSEAIVFAMQVFNALDNNNYVRFFRLVREKATYLQACILLRYFNDVRARALARIVKAFAPRGGSRYPAEELMNSLAFESIENMKSFVNHYGIRFAKVDDCELTVILDRNQFIEDSDPYPISRAIKLIESKRHNTVGEIIAGGTLPPPHYKSHIRYTSFTSDGRLKEAAFIAEEQGYNTINDSNKDVRVLRAEMQRLSQGGRNYSNVESKSSPWSKPQVKAIIPEKSHDVVDSAKPTNKFIFSPAIVVALKDDPKILGKVFEGNNNKFVFSKPQELPTSNPCETKFTVFKPSKVEKNNIFSASFTSKGENNWIDHPKPSLKSASKNETEGSLFRQPKAEAHSDKHTFNIFAKAKNEAVFRKPEGEVIKSGNLGNIFMKPADAEGGSVQNSSSIFANFNKTASVKPELNNIFSKPVGIEDMRNQNSYNNVLPGSLFKSACNPPNGSEPKAYSIFQTKNKERSVAADLFKSVTQTEFKTVYDFDPHEETNKKLEEQREHHRRLKEEERLRELQRKEEQKQEELRLQEEERRKQEEIKQLEEKRRKEEERKQEELKRKLEEEKKATLKRKAEEDRIFRERVDKESVELVEELVDELRNETIPNLLKDELEKLHNLIMSAKTVSEEIVTELCSEISQSEMRAETFLTEKLMKKWFAVWRNNFIRNYKRRYLLENAPVWLTDNTPIEEAAILRRHMENAALKNMNAIHRGYKFNGELKQLPSPDKYNIMEIIKSPLLKRMKNVNYPYDKCFFWKVTLVPSITVKWICKKIDIEKWLLDAFSDKNKHDESDSLIHVGKQSWNNLMDFAISVSLANKDSYSEAMEGTNGVLFYFSECEKYFVETINETLKHTYPYQIIPITVVMPKLSDHSMYNSIESLLTNYLKNNSILAFKIYELEPQNLCSSLDMCTRSALKLMAKKYPQAPNLETDYLKFICQRYLANEIWCRLKSETDGRVSTIIKDLRSLVKCYNVAVDKLVDVITNEELFNYPPFPLEFKAYLDHTSPYPKPYEFIASNARVSENIYAIRDLVKQLKLPDPVSEFHPVSVTSMQQQIRKYCNQIRWFENPEQVVCKVVAVLPNQFMDLDLPRQQFTQNLAHYNLVDFLNVIVCEKINRLNNFENRFAIYDRSTLKEYRNMHWLFEVNMVSSMKYKSLNYEDELDYFIEAKRRKLSLDSMELLMLQDNDTTLVEENIKATDENISKYNNCEEVVKQLEQQLEEGKKKSIEFENLLRIALSDV